MTGRGTDETFLQEAGDDYEKQSRFSPKIHGRRRCVRHRRNDRPTGSDIRGRRIGTKSAVYLMSQHEYHSGPKPEPGQGNRNRRRGRLHGHRALGQEDQRLRRPGWQPQGYSQAAQRFGRDHRECYRFFPLDSG